MSCLIIVESPGKIKKISSFLDDNYIVMASVGHIRDLSHESHNGLGFDINDNFKPDYEVITDKKKVISSLKNTYKTCNRLIIASDGDREGEAIGYHLVDVLKPKNYDRIVFNEITKKAILTAISKPSKIDMNMFYSQQTRRILDRLVGFKLSPILKNINGLTYAKSLGTGRVQSVVTRLIVEKENEINTYLSSDKATKSDFKIYGNFNIENNSIRFNLVDHKISINNISINDFNFNNKISNVKINKVIGDVFDTVYNINNILDVELFIHNFIKYPIFKIVDINQNERFRHPAQPFITTTLQQEASYKLRLPIKKTMMLAQMLYEKGLITYMRTDSPMLSNDSLNSIKQYILNDDNLGENYYQYRQFKSKNQSAQEAHEAIRPTHIETTDLINYNLSDPMAEKLYELIWNRTIASQMKSAKYNDIIIDIRNDIGILFEGKVSNLIFDGFLKIYEEHNDKDTSGDDIIDIKLDINKIKINDIIEWKDIKCDQKYHNPPTRYNEPSLVKKLESLGIGRPSTYANIISKIQEHKYVEINNVKGIEKQVSNLILDRKSMKINKKITKQSIGGEKSKLIPTNNGILVTNHLIKYFPDVLDFKFTARLEDELDDIAEGKKIWYNLLRDFYDIFKNRLYQFIEINKTEDNNDDNNKKSGMIIICQYNSNDVYYLVTKFGPCIKFKLNEKDTKDTFIGVKSIPDENTVLELIEKMIDKKDEINDNLIGKYTNKEDIIYMNGKYGPCLKVSINKKVIFVSVKQKPNLQDAIILINNHLDKNKINIKLVKNKTNTNTETENNTDTIIDPNTNKMLVKVNKKVTKKPIYQKVVMKKNDDNDDDLFEDD